MHNSTTLTDKIRSLTLVTWSGVEYIFSKYVKKQQFLAL